MAFGASMWKWYHALALALAATSGGCSIHPLPDDVLSARLDTVSIVHRIRCEARMAWKLAIADYFQNTEQFAVASPTYQVGGQLRNNEFLFVDLNKHLSGVDPQAAGNVRLYEQAVVGYDFTFDMSEDNGYTAQVDLLQLFTSGTTGVGLKGGADFQRQTVRVFRTSDTFEGLMHLDEKLDCGDQRPVIDYTYPVRGNIGVGEMLKTFVQLNESEKLTGAKQGDKVPVMSDTFNFQTTLSGSATPAITLAPIGHRYGLADANAGFAAMRKDIHKVIIAMSLPPSKYSQVALGAGGGVGLVGTNRGPVNTATDRVNRALDDQINRSIVNQLSMPR
jgi:hypothetical protein